MAVIERDVNHAIEVGWAFDVPLHKGRHPLRAQLADEEPKLENDVLTGSRPCFCASPSTMIIGGHEYNSEANARGFFTEFGNDGPALVRALVEDNSFKTDLLNEASYRLTGSFIMAMDDEHAVRMRGQRHLRSHLDSA
ncbi:hypothetical protein AEGHOMDF_4502 [Methylobacterium soli]|nr:hypothetical protein AEGHOMDF_4502 [Methylobacterium soli]